MDFIGIIRAGVIKVTNPSMRSVYLPFKEMYMVELVCNKRRLVTDRLKCCKARFEKEHRELAL